MSAGDTIFALSSGAGMAGIAVVRVSGRRAGAALEALGGSLSKARVLSRVRFRHPATGETLDDGMAVWMPGPASFTGEDAAELHLHGSSAVVAAVLAALGSLEGLRAAEPGEFTRRAFRNQRIDLVEAEGLGDLIRARTGAQRRQALQHMLGEVSRDYEVWRRALIDCLGRVEAAVDFIEEDDVAAKALLGVGGRLRDLRNAIAKAIADSRRGRAIREGVKVVLAGPANTGKSSLLNRIAQREAALVSPIAGTTRDAIEVPLDLQGIPAILTDTAGLREASQDQIETMGMARTRSELAGADIVVWVSSPDIADSAGSHIDSDSIRVQNKADLLPNSRLNRNESNSARYYLVSALTGAGIPDFLVGLTGLVKERFGREEPVLAVRERHLQSLQRCLICLDRAIDSPVEQIEIVAENLRSAATELGRITGRIDVEDLLDSIFGDFCIGK
jgi:tRNA modification GTPase